MVVEKFLHGQSPRKICCRARTPGSAIRRTTDCAFEPGLCGWLFDVRICHKVPLLSLRLIYLLNTLWQFLQLKSLNPMPGLSCRTIGGLAVGKYFRMCERLVCAFPWSGQNPSKFPFTYWKVPWLHRRTSKDLVRPRVYMQAYLWVPAVQKRWKVHFLLARLIYLVWYKQIGARYKKRSLCHRRMVRTQLVLFISAIWPSSSLSTSRFHSVKVTLMWSAGTLAISCTIAVHICTITALCVWRGLNQIGHNVRKRTLRHVRPTKTQIRLRIAQSDLSLRCPHEEILHPFLSKKRPVMILIRLHECAGWSESSLGAHVRRYICWRCGWNHYLSAKEASYKTRN